MSSSDAFQEEKRKIAKTFSEGRLFTGSDPNKALPEYKSAVLPTHQCAYSFTDTPVCLQFYRHTSVLTVLPTHQCAYNFTDTPVCLQFYRHTSVLTVLPTHQCAYSFTDTPVCSFLRKSSHYTLAYCSVRGNHVTFQFETKG